MLGGRKRRDVWLYAFGRAEVIQQSKDLMVDRDRAGLVVDVALTVNCQCPDIPVPEQARRDSSRWAVTDDDDPVIAPLPV
jgi:hypothetical protein